MSDQTDAIVAQVEAAYAAAYSAADPYRLGAIFAPKATVQTEWGPILDGRGEIRNGLVALFAAKPVPDALSTCHSCPASSPRT
jgi:ketosteroid isomerase-like protein